MKARRVVWAATTGLAALVSAVLVAQPASAHAPFTTQVVYAGGTVCVIARSQIHANHGDGNLAASASTTFRVHSGGDCSTIDVLPPGNIAVKHDFQKWNGSAWTFCRGTGWVYNSGAWNYEVWASNFYGAAPCGRGHYRTLTSSLVWDGSVWRGGSLGSPSHPPVP